MQLDLHILVVFGGRVRERGVKRRLPTSEYNHQQTFKDKQQCCSTLIKNKMKIPRKANYLLLIRHRIEITPIFFFCSLPFNESESQAKCSPKYTYVQFKYIVVLSTTVYRVSQIKFKDERISARNKIVSFYKMSQSTIRKNGILNSV